MRKVWKGVSLVRTQDTDLVILDIGLPDISGLHVLRALREFSDVPVVMLTGQDRDVDIANYLREGADDYVVKPFSQIELIARIEAVVRRSGRQTRPNGENKGAWQPGLDGAEDRELYEGNVRIIVMARDKMGLLVSFAQQVREYPELRLLRLTDSGVDGVDIRLALRQPIPLRDILGEMEGVSEVRPAQSHALRPVGEDPYLTVTLADS